jgi:hypothetical protein
MDKNFLEIWTDMFTKAAQSQKTIDYFTTWMRQGFTGIEEMAALFQNTCGLGLNPKQKEQQFGGQEYLEFWEKARQEFKKSFADYLAFLGSVPREQYLEVAGKYEALKQKVTSQEETINYLRMLLAEQKKLENDALQGKVHDLVMQQAEQFKHVMNSFSQGFKADESKPAEKKKK